MKPVPIYDSSGSAVATSTTITVKMPICYFSDVNGPIKKIQILVSESGGKKLYSIYTFLTTKKNNNTTRLNTCM